MTLQCRHCHNDVPLLLDGLCLACDALLDAPEADAREDRDFYSWDQP
jgi:hypothetical protein